MAGTITSDLEHGNSAGAIRLLRYTALIAVALIVIAANFVLFRQIDLQLQRSHTAESDSTAWVLSQIEVDLLRFVVAVHTADETQGDKEALDEVRLRYDLLYSRVDLVGKHQRLSGMGLVTSPEWQAISGPDGLMQRAMVLMDGDDAALIAALPTLFEQAQALTRSIRGVVIASLKDSLRVVETQRGEMRASMQVFSAVALALLGIMAAMIITIYLQSRARENHRKELAQAVFNLRTTIDSSLEAAVILDHEGRVIGCNRAGAEMFSWEEGGRVVRYLADVVQEAKRGAAGMAEIAKACAEGSSGNQGRITLTGSRANGDAFPLEVSLALARSAAGTPIAIAFLRDISERVEREDTLREARNAALKGEEAKSRFLALMSHEMRTPLNGLLSAVELLTAGTTLDPKQDWLIKIIDDCGRATLDQVNNVLELTKLQANDKLSYPATDFCLNEVVTSLISQFDAEARKRGNTFVSRFTGVEMPMLRGKKHLLMRVLSQLLSNAVKFTERGIITLSVDVQTGRLPDTCALRISVSDTGVGIAEEDKSRIFRAFETVDASYTRLQEGSGLGLGLAKLAVEAMGGRINVTSRKGEGSTFSVFLTLPVVPNPQPADVTLLPRRTQWRPLSVLVVEDNLVNRVLLVELLTLKGHRVLEARDGAEGVELANTAQLDAILMDVSMPVMDGLDATRAIRAGGPSKDVPIIGVTANADQERYDYFRSSGMNEVMSKPVDLTRLEAVLMAHVGPADTTPESAAAPEPKHLRLVSVAPALVENEAASSPAPQKPVAAVPAALSLPESLPPLLDFEILDDLQDALGADYMAKMTRRFVDDTEAALAAMHDCATAGDLPGAAQVAHKNAGAAASLGLRALHKLFVAYERQAKQGDGGSAEETKAMIVRIKQETFEMLRERGLTA